jgi:hypothetical protein
VEINLESRVSLLLWLISKEGGNESRKQSFFLLWLNFKACGNKHRKQSVFVISNEDYISDLIR